MEFHSSFHISKYIDIVTPYNLKLAAQDTDARYLEALKLERGGGRACHLLILSICKAYLLVADILKTKFKRFI
jgi:hypothetical protein